MYELLTKQNLSIQGYHDMVQHGWHLTCWQYTVQSLHPADAHQVPTLSQLIYITLHDLQYSVFLCTCSDMDMPPCLLIYIQAANKWDRSYKYNLVI